jgi:hypothetical protein
MSMVYDGKKTIESYVEKRRQKLRQVKPSEYKIDIEDVDESNKAMTASEATPKNMREATKKKLLPCDFNSI